jgi:glycosyltransferase involved in cell wall biosynthesis
MLILPTARILKIKMICLVLPENELPQTEKTKKQLSAASRDAVLAVFLKKNQEQLLRLGCRPEAIRLLSPAIRLHQHKFQENIFHKIAQAETQTKKFFNIGLVNGLETEEQVNDLELVFQAIKQARLIIPNIQLIVVGDGRQKKKLIWLAKKMELESLVWLVGEQQHLRKWLDSFDALLTIKTKPTLDDLLLVLKAMEAELPVIAPADTGFEELIDDGVSGLLAETASSEALAAQIIRLKQDKRLMLRLRQAARERVEKQFNLARAVAIFKEIL